MLTNPILSSTAVWHGRRLVQDAVSDLHLRGHDNLRNALDAYAAAILAEVRRRVEGMHMYAEFPPDGLEGVYGGLRDTALAQTWDLYLNRAAVLRVLDGGEA